MGAFKRYGAIEIGDGSLKILLDHCVTSKLKPHLAGHDVVRAYDLKWQELSNGSLLSAAESKGFEVVITVDANISLQQNMAGRQISVNILQAKKSSIDFLIPLVPQLRDALGQISNGEIRVIAAHDN